jgi:uncharacterized membrane protein YgcG
VQVPISLAHTVPRSVSLFSVTPEQRAKAVAERFAAELPSRSVPEMERIVASAIKRALAQQLAELEDWAKRSAEYAMGRGKDGKGRNEAAMRIHDEWANRFRRMRNGHQRN